MTNEEKAKEISQQWCYDKQQQITAYESALEAMQWKDEQHAKEKESFFKEYRKEILDACIYDFEQEKQQWIDKVTNFISQHFYISTSNHVISKKDYYSLTELIRDINKAMEE